MSPPPTMADLVADFLIASTQADFALRRANQADGTPAEPAAEAEWRACEEAVHRAAQRIVARRPANISEAAAKYTILLRISHDGEGQIDDASRLIAFLDDLTHLAAPPPPPQVRTAPTIKGAMRSPARSRDEAHGVRP